MSQIRRRQGITAAGSGCKAALAAERWLTHHDLATLVHRDTVEPGKAELPTNVDVTTETSYDPNGLWQKGSFALRKLYHDSDKPLLVVYTSPTCGPCHVLKPQLQRVINDLDGAAQAVVIDIETDQDIAEQAGVNGTPTVQLFHRKAMVQQWRGVKQRSVFRTQSKPCWGCRPDQRRRGPPGRLPPGRPPGAPALRSR